MEQPTNSPESSRPNGAEPATSRAEGGASAIEHKEDEILDSEALIVAADRGELARIKEIIKGMIINNHTEGVLELLKVGGIDVDAQNSNGETTLMTCYKGLTEVALEQLKVGGRDVNAQNSNGETMLTWVCSNGLTEVALELLKVGGVDVNAQNINGDTALMVACSYGRTDIALGLLRDPRVDRHIKYRGFRTALGLARNKGLTAVVTRFEALRRGDERMPLVKVYHRYLHGDGAAEGAQAPHPPESAITKTLVDKNLVLYISRFLGSLGRQRR